MEQQSGTIQNQPVETGVSSNERSLYAAIRASRWFEPGFILALFLLLTVVMTWPLPPNAHHAVQDLGDPLYDIWAMRWAQHQLLDEPAQLWNANTGYPFRLSFLFSEPRLSTSILAWPIVLATGNDVLAYNLMFLLSFVILGVGMALLVREITGRVSAAVIAGILAAFTTYRFGHLSHLNLLSYGWLVLVLWALMRFRRRRSVVDALLATLFLSIQVLASDTLALMALGAVGLLLPFIVFDRNHRPSRRLIIGSLAVLVVPALLLIPVILGRMKVNDVYGFERDLQTVRDMSATLRTYVSVHPFNHFWSDRLPTAYPNPLFPGAVTLIGAVLGATLGLSRWPRWALYAMTLSVVGFVFSLGPETEIAGLTVILPFRWLFEYVPGMTSMRDVARFGMLALLGMQMLAGMGFAAALSRLHRRLPAGLATIAVTSLLVVTSGFALIEARTPVGAVEVPRSTEDVAVYQWLAQQPEGPVIEFPANGLWTDVLKPIGQIYYSTWHWHPIMAAYTSFLPERHLELLLALHATPDALSTVTSQNVGILQDLGIRYAVIHWSDNYDYETAVREAEQVPGVEHIATFDQATAFQIASGDREPTTITLTSPETATAGRTIQAVVTLRNPNSNYALVSVDPDPTITATWIDPDGRDVARHELRAGLPVTAEPGASQIPLEIPVPGKPGQYELQLTATALIDPVNAIVTVDAIESAPNVRSIRLRQVEIDLASDDPAGVIKLTMDWKVLGQIERDLTSTAQLLDETNQVVAQVDDVLFQPSLGASIEAGTTLRRVIEIPLSAVDTGGSFRLLVALYESGSSGLPRELIALPDGSEGTEWISTPFVIE